MKLSPDSEPQSTPSRFSCDRRQLLAATTAGVATLLSGCSALPGDIPSKDTTSCSTASASDQSIVETPGVETTAEGLPSVNIDVEKDTVGDLLIDPEIEGCNELNSVTMSDGVGTIQVGDTTIDAIAYRRIEWESIDKVLYQLLGVRNTALYLGWVYTEGDASVTTLHIEGTDGTALNQVQAKGTVTDNGGTTTSTVRFPALSLAKPTGTDAYQVEGTDLAVGTGDDFVRYPTDDSVPFAGQRLSVVVFETVDCSSCGSGSWYELHSLMWPPDGGELLVGIFYLFPGDTEVRLSYQIALPSLIQPSQKRFDADWSRT